MVDQFLRPATDASLSIESCYHQLDLLKRK